MAKLGILGGGQLALMIGLSAKSKGLDVIVYSNVEDFSAKSICLDYIVGDFGDVKLLTKFSEMVDHIIYEFENVDIDVLSKLDPSKLFSGIEVLKISQSRRLEKQYATNSKIKTCDYIIGDANQTPDLSKIKFPVIVKTDRMGYDGRGQVKFNKLEDVNLDVFNVDYIVESVVDFDYEGSAIFYKKNDDIYFYESFKNTHKNGILLKTQLLNIELDLGIYFNDFIKNIKFNGILCIEFFVKGEDIIFNEIAPRVHNSAHITLKSHFESQFDNLINLYLNYPINSQVITNKLVMLQVLGQDYEYVKNNYNFYDYGKNSSIENRKVGHMILSLSDCDKILKGENHDEGSFYTSKKGI